MNASVFYVKPETPPAKDDKSNVGINFGQLYANIKNKTGMESVLERFGVTRNSSNRKFELTPAMTVLIQACLTEPRIELHILSHTDFVTWLMGDSELETHVGRAIIAVNIDNKNKSQAQMAKLRTMYKLMELNSVSSRIIATVSLSYRMITSLLGLAGCCLLST